MFARTVRGVVSDRSAVRAAYQRWLREVAPGATGWLGSTTGISEDGQFFSLLRYASEDDARRDRERPEQLAWWSEVRPFLEGEPTFTDGTSLYVEEPGNAREAGFVQVVFAQTTDIERSRQIAQQTADLRAAHRPEILATVVVGQAEGRYAMLVHFTSEAAAHEGERKPLPPEAIESMRSMSDLTVGPPEYLDLPDPWIDVPSS